MVSKASEDFPEPDSPVMTTSRSRGRSTSMFLRLWTRAPRMEIQSFAMARKFLDWPNGYFTVRALHRAQNRFRIRAQCRRRCERRARLHERRTNGASAGHRPDHGASAHMIILHRFRG